MKYDIVIIGGGMVGAALALALQQTPFKIALIDAAAKINADDPRLIGLNHASYRILKQLNIWESLQPHAGPIAQIHVSHRGHFGITRIHAHEFNLDALGFVVPAKFINAALYQNLDPEKVSLFQATKLKNITQQDDCSLLQMETPNGSLSFEADIVFAADGTHSTVRELLNIPMDIHDYQQEAIVTVTTLNRPQQNIAYERFLENGAIAMLPLSSQTFATIWTDTKEKIAELMQLEDPEFIQTLQSHFGYRLGRLKSTHKRHVFPLQRQIAKQQIKENIILLGNAAHTLYPVASQGLNLAFYEIATLAKHFSAVTSPKEFNTQEYLKQVSQQQNRSARLSHQLSWLFSTDFPGFSFARKLSMIGFDICSLAKKKFAKVAIGAKGL